MTPPSEIPPASTGWGEFRRGFMEHSSLGILGALLVPLVQVVCMLMYATPQTVASWNAGYFLNNRFDAFTQASFDIQHMRHGPHAPQGVLIVGSSTLREAIFDDRLMADSLGRRTGTPTDVFRVATGWQSLWETAGVIDHLPDDFRGVVVIGMDPGRLGRNAQHMQIWLEDPLFALDSPVLRDEIRRLGLNPPRRTGFYLLDHARFFSTRRATPLRLLGGPIQYDPHFTAKLDNWSEEKWQQAEQGEFATWVASYQDEKEANLDVLRRILRRLKRRGVDAVLLETPLHPRALAACQPTYGDYCRDMQGFAAEMQVPYWNLDRTAEITAADFCDWIHLKTTASQARYQAALVEQLVPLLAAVPSARDDTARDDGRKEGDR